MTFHTDPEVQLPILMWVKERYFPSRPFPAWTAVEEIWLAGFDLEIKVTARISGV